MSSLPSPSKSNTATPPGVNSGTTYIPSGQGAGLSSKPTAPVISVNNPPDPAGPHCESLRDAEVAGALPAPRALFFPSSRLHPDERARQITPQLKVDRNIIFPISKK